MSLQGLQTPPCARGVTRWSSVPKFVVGVAGIAAVVCASAAPAECAADLDGNGIVDAADLTYVLRDWGILDSPADLDGDGTVGSGDLSILLGAWGECPAGLRCSGAGFGTLSDDGSFTMPDWTGGGGANLPFSIDEAPFGGSYALETNPAPGTVFSGISSLDVTVTVTGANGFTQECIVLLTLVDVTAPFVAITGVEDGDEVVTPSSFIAGVQAFDAVTAEESLAIEVLLDGLMYLPSTPITTVGSHTLIASATDAAGNRGYAVPVTFEIRKFPMVEGVAVVSDMTCTLAGGFAQLDATVYIAAEKGMASPLDVETMALWPLNANGLPLNDHAIYVAGSTSPDGHYEYASAEAEYQQGYWALHFSAVSRADQILDCPASFLITASGNRETSEEFDFEAECVAQINPEPLVFLQMMGVLNNDPPKLPPVAPQCPPCKWKWKRVRGPLDTINTISPDNCFGGYQYWTANLTANGGNIDAYATAVDECTGNAVASKSVTSDEAITVWLEGRKECCDPSITVTLKPKFKAKVAIDPPAQSIAAGLIDITSTIGAATRALGGVECSDNPATTITFGAGASVGKDGPGANANISVQMNLTQGANELEDTFIGNDIKKGNVDTVKISIVGSAKTKTLADASIVNWYAYAKAEIWGSTLGITVEPTCSQTSECAGVSETFNFN